MHSCDDHEKNGGVWLGFNQGIDVTGSGYVQINRRDDGKTEVS